MLVMKRRDVLAGGAALTMASRPNSASAGAQPQIMTVYTQGLPQAREQALKSARDAVALGDDIVRAWTARLSKHRGAVKGYTNWSDYVLLRGLAEEQGLRLRAEATLRVAGGKTLFRWIMA